MKFNKEIAEKIVGFWRTGEHTISDICIACGISRETYYRWKDKRASFGKQIAAADVERMDRIKEVATSGLMTLLRGKEFEEITTEYVEGKPDQEGNTKPKIKSQKKVKRIILPNAATVIFVMKNLDQENFPNVVSAELTGKGGSALVPVPTLNIETVAAAAPILDSEPDQTEES